jgi:hypothetical protein
MASDFSVAWQCPSKRTIGVSLRIKLHANLQHILIQPRVRHIAYIRCKNLQCNQISNFVKHTSLCTDRVLAVNIVS